jgi:hypothetical protein
VTRKATTTTAKPKRVKNPDDYQVCSECHKEKKLTTGFYMVKNNMLYPKNRLIICKVCLKKKIYNEDNTVNIEKLQEVLKQLNMPFLQDVYNVAKNQNDIVGDYFRQINSMPQYQGLTWNNAMNEEADNSNKDNIQKENNEVVFVAETVIITEEDKKIQEDVNKMLGYDPFAGYSTFDKKFLYGELLPYLDEDTLEDQYKISVILQILNNNNQIRKIDLAINRLGSNAQLLIDNDTKIKGLTSIKSQIAKQSDNLSKENGIAVKHRGDKKSGKSTLTAIMKDYREKGFDEAEEDYYDQNKAYGMQLVADVSNKSILEQLQFDENDISDMFFSQKQLIQELNKKVADLEEELRVLHIQCNENKEE